MREDGTGSTEGAGKGPAEPPTPEEEVGGHRRGWLPLVSVLVSAVLFVLIYWWAGPGETLAVMGRVGLPGFVGYAGVVFVILCVHVVGWDLLLRVEGIRVAGRQVVAGLLSSYAISYVTPSMYLGGEPARVHMIARVADTKHRRVAGTVILHKVAEFSGFVISLVLATLVVLLGPSAEVLSDRVRWVLIAGDAFFALSFAYLLFSFITARHISIGVLTWLGRRISRWRRFFYRLAARARGAEEVIHAAFRDHPKRTLLTFAIMGGSLSLVFIKPAVFFWFLRGEFPFAFQELCILFCLTQFVLAFQITPGGLGIYEGGQVAAFALIDVGAPEAIAYATFVRAVDVAITAVGFGILSHYGMMAVAREGGLLDREIDEMDMEEELDAAARPVSETSGEPPEPAVDAREP